MIVRKLTESAGKTMDLSLTWLLTIALSQATS
jgi:hypothetical protein